MKMSSVMIPVLLLSFVACQSESKKSNVAKKNDEVSTPTNEEESTHPRLKITKKRKTELKKDFSNFSIFKEDINSYKVNFEAISGHYTNAIVECAKGHFDREKELFLASFDESGFKASVELSISDKDPLDVEFECKVMDQDLELDDAKIHLRKSFVVSGIKNPYSLGVGFGPIETLVFEEGAMLLTEGVYLNIEAKEIISRGGEIVTFTEESTLKALDDQHGASGGIINIVTETSVGKLSVQLRGKNAGKQTRVPEVMKEIPGRDLALDGTCKGDKQDYSDKDQRCFGKRGHQGFKGNKGFNGLNGGSSGAFFYKAKKLDDLKIKVDFFPGKGSAGGIGGEGGQGGPGGVGSTLYVDIDRRTGGCPVCDHKSSSRNRKYKYPDGAQGAKGDLGDSGDVGEDGASDNSIVHYLVGDMKFNFNYPWQNF